MSRVLLASALLSLLVLSSFAESFETRRVDGRSLQQQKKGKGGGGKGKETPKRQNAVKGEETPKKQNGVKGEETPKKQSATKGEETPTKQNAAKGEGKLSKAEARAAKADRIREEKALKEFARQERRRQREKEEVLKRANKESDVELTKFNKALSEEDQITVFVNLWRNARGPTILILLTKLIASSKSSAASYTQVVAESMLEAQRKGFSFQISDGLSAALTIVENEKDGEPLLDAVMINMRAKNGAKKGSGCTYVKNLFEDAEVIAIENGYEMDFTRAFDADAYLPIAECFYAECDKAALACCKNNQAISTGTCNCDKKEPNLCDFNMFLNAPRPIWKCNGESCDVVKCLCPFVKTKNTQPKGKGKGQGKGQGKPKRGKNAKRT